MQIWIDQGECQNSGLCEESFPRLFKIGTDFVSNLRDGDTVIGGASASSPFEIPSDMEDDAVTAARDCPAQCIHLAN